MSDEQAPRRGPGGEPRPDETRQFSPFQDDDQTRVAGIHPDGGTRSGDAGADPTQQMPPVDDATVVDPRDATSVMPPAREWAEPEGAWSGRAEVRPPRPGPGEYTAVSEWDAVPPPAEPRGRWWMPILVGILALLLIGLLIWGIYLIAQNADDDDPGTPAPAPSVTAPATTEPTTTPPTSEAPTATTPTTTEPTGPTEVTVPALVGLSQDEAQEALDRRGLTYRLIFRPSDAQAGTVIDSDPAEGQEVPPDTQVTLVIAAEATEPTATQPTGATDQPDED
jgi:hypothetical protein